MALTPMTDLSRTRAEIERGVARGWHTGAQVYASVDGATVADFAVGEARPGVIMSIAVISAFAMLASPAARDAGRHPSVKGEPQSQPRVLLFL